MNSPTSPQTFDTNDYYDACPCSPLPSVTDVDVQQFIDTVSAATNIAPDSCTAQRFLRARKGDVVKAVQFYLKDLSWRRQMEVEDILNAEDPNELAFAHICPSAWLRNDRFGRPVYLERSGDIDASFLSKIFTRRQINLRHLRHMEAQVRRMSDLEYLPPGFLDPQTLLPAVRNSFYPQMDSSSSSYIPATYSPILSSSSSSSSSPFSTPNRTSTGDSSSNSGRFISRSGSLPGVPSGPAQSLTWIMDMKGLKLSVDKKALSLFKDVIEVDQNHYPERLGCLVIINAPAAFKAIWALVRPWIDPATKAKVHIKGKDYHEFLTSIISPEFLPVEYGGTSKTIVPVTRPWTGGSRKHVGPGAGSEEWDSS